MQMTKSALSRAYWGICTAGLAPGITARPMWMFTAGVTLHCQQTDLHLSLRFKIHLWRSKSQSFFYRTNTFGSFLLCLWMNRGGKIWDTNSLILLFAGSAAAGVQTSEPSGSQHSQELFAWNEPQTRVNTSHLKPKTQIEVQKQIRKRWGEF